MRVADFPFLVLDMNITNRVLVELTQSNALKLIDNTQD